MMQGHSSVSLLQKYGTRVLRAWLTHNTDMWQLVSVRLANLGILLTGVSELTPLWIDE